MDFKILVLGIIILGLVGCAPAPTPTSTFQPKPFNASIFNYSNSTIETIHFQDCDSASNDWSIFSDQPLLQQKSIELPLTRSCINLKALDKNGKEIGKQWGIKKLYPFLWQIR